MSVLNNLLPASFNGIPFLMESDSHEGGKQLIQHQFLFKSYIFNEETGRKSRTFKIKALVHGDGYELRRDALILALNLYGKGVLIHPFYGLVIVKSGEYSVSHEMTEVGLSRFDLTFYEDLLGIFPASIGSTVSDIEDFAEQTIGRVGLNFLDNFTTSYAANITSAGDKLVSLNKSLNENIAASTDIPQDSINEFNVTSTDFDKNIYATVIDKTNLASTVQDLLSDYDMLGNTAQQSYNLAAAAFNFGSDDFFIDYKTVSSTEAITNAKSLNSLINATILSYLFQNAASIDYYDDEQLNSTLFDIEEKYQIFISNNNLSTDNLRDLETLRNKTRQLLESFRTKVNKVIKVDVPKTPLSVLLYKYYDTFDNENEILKLNNIADSTSIFGNIKMVTIN